VTLGELIIKRKDELEESYDDLSARAGREGYSISRAAIHNLATNHLKQMPQPGTIFALAAALDMDPGTIAIAALASVGIELVPTQTGNPWIREWVTLTGDRDDAQKRHLLNVARTVAEALDDARDMGQSNAPPDRDG
jgi:hypothetical protein